MKSFTGWSIRTCLFLLVFLSVAPGLVIIVHSGLEQRREALADVRDSCTTFIHTISADLENTVTATRQMLATLSILPEVKRRDRSACDRLLADILRNNPRYISLHMSHPGGDIFASALALKGVVNVQDRKYFRDAVHTRSFSTGEYVLGKQSQKPMFNFAYPVTDQNGDLLGVLEAGINLADFSRQIPKVHLPPGASLTIVDHNGIILNDSDKGELQGKGDDPALFADMAASKDEDRAITRSIGERRYILVYHGLRLSATGAPYLFVRLQVPEDTALANVHHLVARNLGYMLAFALLAGLAALLFAHLSIVSPTRRLVAASERIAAGDLGSRVGIPHDNGELGLIARAFDKMSETLAKRDAEREEMSRRLKESNRELQQFAYIASHDLQEPLRTITSFIQLLARRYQGKLDKDADEFIGFVTDGARRMQQLIDDLLAYSHVESKGKPFVRFDGEAVLELTLANLRQAIAESGAIVTHDPLPSLWGDRTQMVQLFQNLIANAIKFRGSVPPLIHVGMTERPGEWEISVSDNGIGIDPACFERIFEIFQRLHSREQYAGTGIGLAMCRKIVERHGGRIGVTSEPGRGATFTCTISKGVPASS